MKALKLLKLEIWKAKFYVVCELPAWWKSTQTHLLTKVRDFERSAPSKTWKCKLYSFFTRPLGENYSNSSFDKSKGLNNQEAEKMKSICSNHIFEPTLSNHFLQIDVDLIEKLIPCSLLGGPFGGPVCPPVWRYQKMTKKCIFSEIKKFPTLLNENLDVFSMDNVFSDVLDIDEE